MVLPEPGGPVRTRILPRVPVTTHLTNVETGVVVTTTTLTSCSYWRIVESVVRFVVRIAIPLQGPGLIDKASPQRPGHPDAVRPVAALEPFGPLAEEVRKIARRAEAMASLQMLPARRAPIGGALDAPPAMRALARPLLSHQHRPKATASFRPACDHPPSS